MPLWTSSQSAGTILHLVLGQSSGQLLLTLRRPLLRKASLESSLTVTRSKSIVTRQASSHIARNLDCSASPMASLRRDSVEQFDKFSSDQDHEAQCTALPVGLFSCISCRW